MPTSPGSVRAFTLCPKQRSKRLPMKKRPAVRPRRTAPELPPKRTSQLNLTPDRSSISGAMRTPPSAASIHESEARFPTISPRQGRATFRCFYRSAASTADFAIRPARIRSSSSPRVSTKGGKPWSTTVWITTIARDVCAAWKSAPPMHW